ncbi:alpha/beta fold hydrolase [Allosediminivita pacifica]|uniref:Pimeloyl-ACP methyl ester carboxylesterase n=1 Tax=Allosediminivita pacifica TaxID=1267769 RepID=A0A2T6A923_9RHOB|nr:alpha/beta hydrolase [Allosediminivita pacifica]PTX40282.1 pimeloyl-ACP methyl ester carboxylesterase [Allosediminivita pacifica]GGB26519.1 hypothetical protein GCM10011324_40380 [Allosediminivita pacifica]
MQPPAHYNITGQAYSLPDLVFVHGYLCDHTDWTPLIERLSDRFRCIALDLPGHGQTPAKETSMAIAGAAVNAVRQAIGTRPAILIGHSLGCKIIREAYRQDPEGIAGLILIDGSLYVSDRETMLSNAMAALEPGMEAFRTALFERMFTEHTTETQRRFLVQRALSVDDALARDFFLDSVDWDARHAVATLDACRVPGMVIQATTFDSQFRWRPLPPGSSTGLIDAMRARLEDFELEIIPDAGHFVMTEQPELTASAIVRFAERIGAPANQTAS